MRKSICAIVLGLVIIYSAGSVYSQEPGTERPPNAPEERPGVPQSAGPMGGMMGHEGVGMMRHEGMRMRRPEGIGMMMHNPRLAGIMMQMRGEMMRIRGEAMMKEGDVLRRYGERLQKEGITKGAPKPGTK